MRNKGLIIFLTVVVSLLCFYYLSFTFVAQRQQDKAVKFATTPEGVNPELKQKYLDSIFDQPVYNVLGAKFTYKEVKENELALGLDLQGGMHVTLEVSPVEILKALAGPNSSLSDFQNAIARAKEKQRNSQENFTELFYESFAEVAPGKQLNSIFANPATRGRISSQAPDNEVRKLIDSEVDQAIDRSFEILRNRIDRFGVVQPNIQRIQGTGRIQVELPGVENPQRVRNLLQGAAQLEFLEVYHLPEIAPYLNQINDYLMAVEKDQKAAGKNNTADAEKLLKDPNAASEPAAADSAAADTTQKASKLFSLLRSPYGLVYDVKDTSAINKILRMPKVQAILPSNVSFYWERKARSTAEGNFVELVPVKKNRSTGKAPLTGEVIVDARHDIASDGRGYEVVMQMNSAGAKKWRQMTKEASSDPKNKRRVAIVLDDVVYSAPTVQVEIPNGNSSITGDFTLDEAKDLANILKAGKLPAPVRIVEEVIVGPTLGKEAIEQGLMSMLAGLGLVVIFMILYYAKGGLVANIALIFNILFILGVMASFNSVLTLPGIAGIVLTIGMAVDANVLIFERIKEELNNGKQLLKAIELGYEKAFSSIFDSNVTTILSGAILFALGSGPVKGFATTLIVGIFCSFFTAVFISRIIIEWMARGSKSISFTTAISKNLFKNINFQIINKRKIAYIFSSALILIGIATIFIQGGLNLGVDFKGGRSYIVQLKEVIPAANVRTSLTDDFQGQSTEVKTFGSPDKLKVTTSYLIDDESAEGDEAVEAALVKGLDEIAAGKYEILSSQKVGATVADDIKSSSVNAILLALIGIFLYIFVRFRKWQFGLGGLVALFHDALMVISIFSILRLLGIPYEVDQVFIASILTIIGFSINDTVIVFDRVREYVGENPKSDLETTLNKSINHTLSRTIMTTVTVLVVVLVLLFFGGETLRGFSLALLIGVIFGSYSTIFIAVPMVLDIRTKKEKEALASGKKPAVEVAK
ncbi:MAG: protein translocase subunit SecDF [Cytophagaceae bacterium]